MSCPSHLSSNRNIVNLTDSQDSGGIIQAGEVVPKCSEQSGSTLKGTFL